MVNESFSDLLLFATKKGYQDIQCTMIREGDWFVRGLSSSRYIIMIENNMTFASRMSIFGTDKIEISAPGKCQDKVRIK